MQLDEKRIQEIVEQVLEKLQGNRRAHETSSAQLAHVKPISTSILVPRYKEGRYGVFPDVDSAVAAAKDAFERLNQLPLELRDKIINAMREVTRRNVTELSQRTVEETGLGRIEDKIKKNLLAANKTPGREILKTEAWTGDDGLTLTERAPYGVIGSITPCTNATETIICNAIGMVAAGNSVVFNTHPSAKKISNYYIGLLNQATISVGGPENLLTVVGEPTIESANQLMEHKDISLVVVTGGPGVVKVAMSKQKKVIAAGPGNPPALIDETAHIDRAARHLVLGASLDNNIVCVVEKEFLAVSSIYKRLREALVREGAYLLRSSLIPRLEQVVVEDNGPNKAFVGKDASYILQHIGIRTTAQPRIILCEVDEAHPFVQHELLMPVIPLLEVRDAEHGIEVAKRVEHGFRHTAVIHSTNIDNMHTMAKVMNCSIFVKNAPSYAGLGLGGEGYASFTIASPTGEGLTCALHFSRQRRCVLKDYFRIV